MLKAQGIKTGYTVGKSTFLVSDARAFTQEINIPLIDIISTRNVHFGALKK
jgi:hypothetical protein